MTKYLTSLHDRKMSTNSQAWESVRSVNHGIEAALNLQEDADADESSNDAQPAGQDTEERFGVADAVVGNHRLYVRALPGMVEAPISRFVVVDARVFRVANYLLPSVVGTCHSCTKAKQKQAKQNRSRDGAAAGATTDALVHKMK